MEETPTLVVPGIDARHPLELTKRIVEVMPRAELAAVSTSNDLRTADKFADAFTGMAVLLLSTLGRLILRRCAPLRPEQ